MKPRVELIIDALQSYRERVLQDNVVDMVLAEYGDKPWDRRDIYELTKQYASIDQIIKALRQCKELMNNSSSMQSATADKEITNDEYNKIVSMYNTLYFNLTDIIG